MARDLDSKVIEANRRKYKKTNEKRERLVREFRDAVKENNAHPRTYEIPPKVSADTPPVKRPVAAGYARVSTQEDAQAESFENQMQHLSSLIQGKGWRRRLEHPEEEARNKTVSVSADC